MVHILAPEINPRRHSKPFKLLLQNPCVLFRFILPCALSAANNNPSAAELLHQRMILRHLRQVIHRRIIINIHIIIIREEISCMEQTAQRKASAEKVRSSQIEIHAMIAAHAHPCKHHSAFIGNSIRFTVNLMQTRQKFLTKITKPLLMPENSAMLVTPYRAPRFRIHTAYTEQLQLSVFQPVRNGIHHASILKIIEFPVLTRKNNHRQPCMPIYLKLHVSLQML